MDLSHHLLLYTIGAWTYPTTCCFTQLGHGLIPPAQQLIEKGKKLEQQAFAMGGEEAAAEEESEEGRCNEEAAAAEEESVDAEIEAEDVDAGKLLDVVENFEVLHTNNFELYCLLAHCIPTVCHCCLPSHI